jgi:hypothetical protein
MEAVGNDGLGGEACPNCFELFSVPFLHNLNVPILIPSLLKGEEKGVVEEALSYIREVRGRSVLKRVDNGEEMVKEYVCEWCERSYIGELDLIANQAIILLKSQTIGPVSTTNFVPSSFVVTLISSSQHVQ